MKITNAAVPASLTEGGTGDGLALFDVTLAGGRIAAVEPASGAPGDIDAAGGILVPAFTDMHTHLDKGHIWPRKANPTGTFPDAVVAVADDRTRHWNAADVAARMEFSLRCAYAHGTATIRTHIDSQAPQQTISWPVFAEMRERWAGRIELQGSSLSGIDLLPDDLGPLFDLVTAHGGTVGAALYMAPAMKPRVTALLTEAEDRGLDIDFHVDETLDPASDCLAHVAAEAKRIGFSGTITCGHCCSLMTMPDEKAGRILDAVAEAPIAIVSLPMCNLYLQDRDTSARRTPRIRGGTLVHEMAARGIPVAIASDNTRDPFYAYGDLDMVEVWREATRVLQLDHPIGAWPRAFSATPASIMGIADRDAVRPGAHADLVLFSARSFSELFSRPQADRVVIRAGAVIDPTLPQYHELDSVL